VPLVERPARCWPCSRLQRLRGPRSCGCRCRRSGTDKRTGREPGSADKSHPSSTRRWRGRHDGAVAGPCAGARLGDHDGAVLPPHAGCDRSQRASVGGDQASRCVWKDRSVAWLILLVFSRYNKDSIKIPTTIPTILLASDGCRWTDLEIKNPVDSCFYGVID